MCCGRRHDSRVGRVSLVVNWRILGDAVHVLVQTRVSMSRASRVSSTMRLRWSVWRGLWERPSVQGATWARAVVTVAAGAAGCRRLRLPGQRVMEANRFAAAVAAAARGIVVVECADQNPWLRIGVALGTMLSWESVEQPQSFESK